MGPDPVARLTHAARRPPCPPCWSSTASAAVCWHRSGRTSCRSRPACSSRTSWRASSCRWVCRGAHLHPHCEFWRHPPPCHAAGGLQTEAEVSGTKLNRDSLVAQLTREEQAARAALDALKTVGAPAIPAGLLCRLPAAVRAAAAAHRSCRSQGRHARRQSSQRPSPPTPPPSGCPRGLCREQHWAGPGRSAARSSQSCRPARWGGHGGAPGDPRASHLQGGPGAGGRNTQSPTDVRGWLLAAGILEHAAVAGSC